MARMSTTLTYYRCPECGNVFWVWRKSNARRRDGHLKLLFCTTCGKRTNHVQLKDGE